MRMMSADDLAMQPAPAGQALGLMVSIARHPVFLWESSVRDSDASLGHDQQCWLG